MKNTGVSIVTLKDESPEPSNPASDVAQKLLSDKLSGHSWKGYTLEELKNMVKDEIYRSGYSTGERHINLLLRKLTNSKSPEDFITILSETYLSTV